MSGPPIYLDVQFDRWYSIKRLLGIQNDASLARILLDCYDIVASGINTGTLDPDLISFSLPSSNPVIYNPAHDACIIHSSSTDTADEHGDLSAEGPSSSATLTAPETSQKSPPSDVPEPMSTPLANRLLIRRLAKALPRSPTSSHSTDDILPFSPITVRHSSSSPSTVTTTPERPGFQMKNLQPILLPTASSSGRTIKRKAIAPDFADVTFDIDTDDEDIDHELDASLFLPDAERSRYDFSDENMDEFNNISIDDLNEVPDEDFFMQFEEGDGGEYVMDDLEGHNEGDDSLDDDQYLGQLVGGHCHIGYDDVITSYAQEIIGPICTHEGCESPYEIQVKRVGTAMSFKCVCRLSGHVTNKFCSQPRIRNMNLGDIMWSSSLVLSGNNHRKLALFSKFLNVGFVNANTHYKLQSHYVVSAIEEYWEVLRQNMFQDLRGKDIVVIGDARNDSPGYCAQYSTYVAMEGTQKHPPILAVVTVDKREAGGVSTNMEKIGLQRAIRQVEQLGCRVVEVVTDQHPQIIAMFKKDPTYKGIKHSFDVWHYAKNLGKRFNKRLAKENNNAKKWAKDIVLHLWYCAKNCGKNNRLFMRMWKGIVHHIINEHTWASGECDHGPLPNGMPTDGKEWMSCSSGAYQIICSEVLNPKLIEDITYLINNRHTGALESFNQHILMYNSKRNSYQPPAYHARCLLAAIDHNMHRDRPYKFNQDGSLQISKQFNKKGKYWHPVPIKESKQYTYIDHLCYEIGRMYLHDELPLKRPVEWAEEDPRHIQPTLHGEAPSREELLQTYKDKRRMENDPTDPRLS